jgi:hypothetical protein
MSGGKWRRSKMKFEKTRLFELDHVYAVNSIKMDDGSVRAFYASEAHDACYSLPLPSCDTSDKRLVWEGPGGTMSMVPLEDRPGEFLAISKFFRLYQWEEAEIVWVWPDGKGGFNTKSLLNIPYIHRFDAIKTKKGLYFIGCNLSDKKEAKDDWSVAGNIFVGDIDLESREIKNVRTLKTGLYRNHGYCRDIQDGVTRSLIGCHNGIFAVTAPGMGGDDWNVEQIADISASDMAMVDLDGDGVKELATIEPFHGQYFRIYKMIDGKWQQIFQHPEVTEFYHVVWGGTLDGVPAFVGGCRRGKQQLFAVVWENGAPKVITIDEGVGPSNVSVYRSEAGDMILSANRETAEAAVYRVKA